MDFHSMKRKRLQSLCKKHGIPANLKNTEMAERLSLIFKEKIKSASSQSGLDDPVMEKGTLQCNEDVIILDEEEETQVNELKSNNTDNHQMVDSDTASGDADLHHGKLESSHKRSAIPSSEENSVQDLVIEGPSAAVTKYMNPLVNDDKCNNHISAYDNVCEIEKCGFEVEQVDTMIHERSNSSEDSQNDVHSDCCNVSDEKRDQLLPSTPQNQVKSGSLNVHQVVASETSEAKDLSMQMTTPVADSEKCIGFSPELLEASVIKGMEPIAFLTPRISTCDMEHSIQSAKMEIIDRIHEVLHEEPNAVDIHDCNLMKISTEPFEYKLVERGDNNVGDSVHVHDDHCGAEVEMVSSDPSQLKLSQKRSPNEDIEDSNASSPEQLEPSLIEGTETETKFTPRITDNLETYDVEKLIHSVKTQKVDNNVGDSVHVHGDHCGAEVELVSSDPSQLKLSQKRSPNEDLEDGNASSIELLESSVIEGTETETKFPPRTTDILVTCDVEKLIQSVKKQKVDNNVRDSVHVHGDHCGAEVELVSSDPSQLKLSQKRSPNEDLEDGNALSLELLESSVIEGTETETKFTPRTTDIIVTCDVGRLIQSVKKQKVDNSQEGLGTSPNAVVVDEWNLWQDSSGEFSYSLLEGEVKKWSDNVDVCVIGKAEDENQVVTKGLERSKCAKDTLEETNVTCGFSPVEAQSSNYEDMDEAPTQLLLSMPQIEMNSCNSNIHHMNSSDPSQVKLSEKTSPVADSEIVLVNRTDDGFGKTSVTAGCSLHEGQFDSNNKDEKPYLYPPAMSQTEVDFYNHNIHEMVHSEGTCQVKLLSPVKTSPVADLDESCGISPMLFKSSVVKTFESKPNSPAKTPKSFPKSCVKMEQVGNHQEVFHAAPDTLVINEMNLLRVSTEEFCQSLVVGDGTNFHDNGTENGGSESEKQADMLGVESVSMAKDALGNSNMTLGYCVSELQSYDSASCKDSDEPFMPEHASDAASGDADAYQEKLQSSQKKSSVKNSVESIGFSPKLLESSMIQGFEAASNLIARTPRPRDIRGTFDMKENMQSVKKQVGTITSKKTSHKRRPLQDIQQN